MAELIDKGHFTALAQLDPREVCSRTLCTFDEVASRYTLTVWGAQYSIYPQLGRIECRHNTGQLHEYFSLFAVHYLLSARNIAPAYEWISEKDMPGGTTFFRGPHAIPTNLITAKVDNSVANFKQLGTTFQGEPLTMADAAFIVHITDRIPVAILYWTGDEEFPAESKLLYDKTLPQHFAPDIVFAMAVGICEELGRQ